jgi:hypothetical protein
MNEIVAAAAYQLNEAILQCNMDIRGSFLHMAALLVQMREERLYRALDYDTFESYLGSLGAEGNRSWLYKLIRSYELFSQKLQIPNNRLIEVGPSKLDVIASVVNEDNKDEWLDKAAALSKSDIILEVRSFQGKPPLSSLAPSAQINPGIADLLKYKSYIEYVKDRPCCICEAVPVDPHHFPVTKGAGGKEVEEWVIPMCRGCHNEFQDHKLKFLNDYAHKWGAYLYGLILKIWETA